MSISNSAQSKIDILTLHRDNLSRAKTFEEYRDAHVSYIDVLLSQIVAEKVETEYVTKWISTEQEQPK